MKATITKNQIKAVQTIMNKIESDRTDRISLLSEMVGREVSSTKELQYGEAETIIAKFGAGNKETTERRRKLAGAIYGISMSIGFLNEPYAHLNDVDNLRMNWEKIDIFIAKRGIVKKPLKEMTLDELEKTYRQLKAITRKK